MIGAASRDQVEQLGVGPGCHVIWNPPTRRLRDRRIAGKAMDDRAALAIATMAGEQLARRSDSRMKSGSSPPFRRRTA